jgi:hypothetical protein
VYVSLATAIVVTSAVIVAGCVNHGDDATPTPDTTSPRAVVERFFHWYVSERNLGRDPMARASLQANGDVTAAFVTSMEAIAAGGRDPMLCSGEIPHAFIIGEPTVSGTGRNVTVASNVSHNAWSVELKQASSVWRITAITCAAG